MTPFAYPEHELKPAREPRPEPQQLAPRKVNNLTLVDGKTFLAATVAGDITPPGAPDAGFFFADTRFLSHYELRIGGHRAVVLSSNSERTLASQIELTTGNIILRDSFDLPENTVHVRREQVLSGDVLFDRIRFANYNLTPVELEMELLFDCDFVDVFQVRGVARQVSGSYFEPVMTEDTATFYYRGRDTLLRATELRFHPIPDSMSASCAKWKLDLQPFATFECNVAITPHLRERPPRARSYDHDANLRARREQYAQWASGCTSLTSSNQGFSHAVSTATGDFSALLIPDGKERIIAAGIPWFATIFGRDSIIAAYQSLLLDPQLAVDTLRVLARYQGTRVNDERDEQPGKILHEYREGEMTRTGEMPFGPYFGSVDSTPLFLILLSETWNWTADEALVQELLPAAYKALEWLETFGDIDGDGFVEYQRRGERGLINQGWKDSWDANMHRDGTVAKPPIALAEVQGYVYDAKFRMASLLRRFGDSHTADRLKSEASELAKRFERAFWMQGRGFYAMALDSGKRPVEVISSNPGHLLFSRMISRDRARAVTQRLMREDVFSGWGWRTLSADERVFNPLSYHRGSIWPHDNSLIAHGMALNEFREPALKALTALFDAALTFRDHRLPELFCGVQRRDDSDVPVHYPVSCSPQAWASGAVFLMLTSVLGIRPAAPKSELNIINPQLPEWLDHLHLRNLRVGKSRVGLDFTRRGTRTFCNVVEVAGDRLVVNVVFKN